MIKYLTIIFLTISSCQLSAETKILAFAGSTSKSSINGKLINEAASIAREMGATVTLIDLKDFPIPLYNADDEIGIGMPEKAKELRRLMMANDAIMIASPEYNGSLTALLKNDIDWTSRSETAKSSREAYVGKKFGIMSASPGMGGGARGLVHLRNIIENIGGKVVSQQVAIPDAYNAFDANGHLKSAKSQAELKQLVSELMR